ncbi:MAG: hypothetical protein V1820_06500 [archaeon]
MPVENSPQTKTAIFFHSDPDGIVSAVNVLLSFSPAGRKATKLFPMRQQELLPGKLRKAKGKFDQVFILDLPPSEKEVRGLSPRTVIIDHHQGKPITGKGTVHLNPRFSGKPSYPVCYQTYVLMGGRDWQAFVGVVDDWGVGLLPSFAARMWKPYGWIGSQENLYLYSDAGRIAFAIESAVKFYGEEKGALLAVKSLLACKTPQEFLSGKGGARKLLKAAEKISREVSEALGKGVVYVGKRLEIYELNSKYNIKREVIQRLKIERPGKYVLVYIRQGSQYNFSLRGPGKIPELISPYGGGHPEAGGGRVPAKELWKFLGSLKRQIEKSGKK